jgi:hypothetical protein
MAATGAKEWEGMEVQLFQEICGSEYFISGCIEVVEYCRIICRLQAKGVWIYDSYRLVYNVSIDVTCSLD